MYDFKAVHLCQANSQLSQYLQPERFGPIEKPQLPKRSFRAAHDLCKIDVLHATGQIERDSAVEPLQTETHRLLLLMETSGSTTATNS